MKPCHSDAGKHKTLSVNWLKTWHCVPLIVENMTCQSDDTVSLRLLKYDTFSLRWQKYNINSLRCWNMTQCHSADRETIT